MYAVTWSVISSISLIHSTDPVNWHEFLSLYPFWCLSFSYRLADCDPRKRYKFRICTSYSAASHRRLLNLVCCGQSMNYSRCRIQSRRSPKQEIEFKDLRHSARDVRFDLRFDCFQDMSIRLIWRSLSQQVVSKKLIRSEFLCRDPTIELTSERQLLKNLPILALCRKNHFVNLSKSPSNYRELITAAFGVRFNCNDIQTFRYVIRTRWSWWDIVSLWKGRHSFPVITVVGLSSQRW